MKHLLTIIMITNVLIACGTNEQGEHDSTASVKDSTSNKADTTSATREKISFLCSSIFPNVETSTDKAGIVNKYRWDSGQILKILFLDGNDFVISKVKQFAVQWSQYCSIKFKFVKKGPADIRISFKRNGGYWSKLGTQSLPSPGSITGSMVPSMNFEPFTPTMSDYYIGSIILHEFGHALGMIHEHQSPPAQIPWNRPAVYREYAKSGWSKKMVNHNILNVYSTRTVTNSAYDKESIMHYSISEDLVLDPSFAVFGNYEISQLDKSFISNFYNTRKPKPKPKPESKADGKKGPEPVGPR